MKKKWIRDALLFGIQTKTWKIMRLNAIFLFLCLSQAWAISGYSQETKLTLKMSDSKIIEVLDEIEEQSEFFFLFNQKLVDVERKVDIDVQGKSIEFILQNLFAGTNVNHMVLDRQILLTTFNQELLPQQQPTVSGAVTDESGQPLPGVTVVVKGTTTGTITNSDGFYSISNVPANATLVFSFVGMRTQEMIVENQTNINVTMEEETIGIEEVVAIGYGTMRKKDLTGAVGSVRSSEIENEAPKDLQQMLRSNIAGLNIGMSTSAKGGGSIQIRGQRTLAASSDPLIVLDGIIYNGSLNDINPNDIESVDVLKDASSAAVYGAKSANGVVIINTKIGKTAKPTVEVAINTGIVSLFRSEDVYSPTEFSDWRTDVMYSINRSAPPYMYNDPRELPSNISLDEWLAYDSSEGDETNVWLRRIGLSDIEIGNYKKGQSTDWKNMVFRSGLEQNYNVSLSGKTDLLTYYWSLGYTNNEGVVVNDDYSVYRSRLKLEATVTDFLKVGINTLFSIRNESGYPVRWGNYVNISPWGQPINEDGTYKIDPTNDRVAARHPLIDSYWQTRNTHINLLIMLFMRKLHYHIILLMSLTIPQDLQIMNYFNINLRNILNGD